MTPSPVRLHCCNLPVYKDALSKPDTWPVCSQGDEGDAQAHHHSLGTCHQVHSRRKKNRTCTQTNRFVLPWTPVEDPCCSTHSLDAVEACSPPCLVCSLTNDMDSPCPKRHQCARLKVVPSNQRNGRSRHERYNDRDRFGKGKTGVRSQFLLILAESLI